jgi:protein arginine N-methyltransferase 5
VTSTTYFNAQHRPYFILAGTRDNLHAKGGEQAYSQYIKHLENTSPAVIARKTEGTVENFASGYQDYLQAPLQVRPY